MLIESVNMLQLNSYFNSFHDKLIAQSSDKKREIFIFYLLSLNSQKINNIITCYDCLIIIIERCAYLFQDED